MPVKTNGFEPAQVIKHLRTVAARQEPTIKHLREQEAQIRDMPSGASCSGCSATSSAFDVDSSRQAIQWVDSLALGKRSLSGKLLSHKGTSSSRLQQEVSYFGAPSKVILRTRLLSQLGRTSGGKLCTGSTCHEAQQNPRQGLMHTVLQSGLGTVTLTNRP